MKILYDRALSSVDYHGSVSVCRCPAGKGDAMENELGYREFCSQFDAFFRRNEKRFGEGNGKVRYHFYPKGFTAIQEKDVSFIRDTNARYYQMESDRLQGDFAVLEREGQGQMRTYCRFSAEKMYEDYRRSGWEPVKKAVYENLNYCCSEEIGILDHLRDYEYVKNRLIIRPLFFDNIARGEGRYVYRKFEDIALVLCILLRDDSEGIDSVKVPGDAFESWRRPFDTVMDTALLNTCSRALPRMYISPLEYVSRSCSYEKGAFMALGSPVTGLGRLDIPAVTTTRRVNGAVAMFYPGVRERIAELYGDSYYVVFTSIHEARLHCRGSVSPRMILKSLKKINRTFPGDEMLSERVYYYDREKEVFEALML